MRTSWEDVRTGVWASVMVTVLVAMSLAPIGLMTATAETTADGGTDADDVPEDWILGGRTYEDMEATIDERLRVMPGARLVVQDSELSFAEQPSGPTGIVAEPGSEVVVRSSTLTTAGSPGAFTVHLAGDAVIDGAEITGAGDVVLQPRPTVSAIVDPVRDQVEGTVPGFELARTLTAANQTVEDTQITGGTAAGLTVGVPVDHDRVEERPSVEILSSTISSSDGPALVCYETRGEPDPDDGSTAGLTEPVDQGPTRLVVEGTELARDGGDVVHCPPAPTAVQMPDRNAPVALPASIELPALLAQPHRPTAIPGPHVLELTGGTVAGDMTGVRVDAATYLESSQTTFDGLATAVHLDAPDRAANLTDPQGTGLGSGVRVLDGALDLDGGALTGTAIGVHATGGDVTVTGTTLTGFTAGVDLATSGTVEDATIQDAERCARLAAPATLTGATLTRCHIAVELVETTGATVTSNDIDAADHAVHVVTPDPEAHPEHYDHTVDANTVDGEGFAYVHDEQGEEIKQRVGAALVAHSSDVRVAKLDARLGHPHVVASQGVTIGAPTPAQDALLAQRDDALAETFRDVWRGVDFELYPGALKGPQGTLEQATGNGLDQAWALVNQTEGLGYEARFVEGDLQMDADAYLNLTGFTDLQQAVNVFGFSGQASFSTIVLDHHWAEVQVGDGVWYEVDPSFEQYDRVAPPDYKEISDVDSHRFYDPYMENVTLGEDWASDLPWGQLKNETQDGQNRTREALNGTTDPLELTGGQTPAPVTRSMEPTRTPETRFQQVATEDQWSVHIKTIDPTQDTQGEISFEATTAKLYGDRITVDGTPSRPEDLETLRNQDGLYQVDRHDVEYTTGLWIDGQLVDLDGKHETSDGYELRENRSVTRHPGDRLTLAVDMRMPGDRTVTTSTTPIRVGGTYSVVLDIGTMPGDRVQEASDGLQRALSELQNETPQAVHNITAQLTELTGTSYFHQIDARAEMNARINGVQEQPLLASAVTGQHVVPFVNGTEENVARAAPFIDVQDLSNAYPVDGNDSRLFGYNWANGVYSSWYEDHIFAFLWNLPATSTIKVLQAANAEGQRLYQINASNANEVLPKLDLSTRAKNQIVDAINRGKWVIAPEDEITYHNWTGTGWSEFDPDTGRAGWLLFGAPTTQLNSESVEPITIEGGSGALLEGVGPDACLPWEGCAYDTRDAVLDWTNKGVGLLDKGATYIGYVYKNDIDIALEVHRYGYQHNVDVGGEVSRLFRHTARYDDAVVPVTKRIADVAGPAGTILDVGINFHEAFFNPDDQGTLTEQGADFVAGTAYDVGTGAAIGVGAAKAAGGAAVVCSAAAGVGAVVCGAGAGIAVAVGGGLLAGSFKDDILGAVGLD